MYIYKNVITIDNNFANEILGEKEEEVEMILSKEF